MLIVHNIMEGVLSRLGSTPSYHSIADAWNTAIAYGADLDRIFPLLLHHSRSPGKKNPRVLRITGHYWEGYVANRTLFLFDTLHSYRAEFSERGRKRVYDLKHPHFHHFPREPQITYFTRISP